MTATVLGWLVTAYADHGELILGASLAAIAAWATYRITSRALRRATARHAERAARPGADGVIDQLELLYAQPPIDHQQRNTNTRKEGQQ